MYIFVKHSLIQTLVLSVYSRNSDLLRIMGNTRSTPIATSTPEEIKLQQAYESLISENKDLEKYFRTLRILVVGKTGSGKSTLIRLLLGDDGPRSISLGRSGLQDINEEWRHPHLPLIIHDSDGINTNGKQMMAKIEKFLGNRLAYSYVSSDQIPKRVHAVWYVFSALDNRVLDDNGLLKMLDGYGKELPLLLIMTHNDFAKKISNGREENVLEQLLESISSDEKRERLRKYTVRVGNEIQMESEIGQIRRVDVDEEALRKVSDTTMQLLAEEVRMTWAACQAVDMMAKVKESIRFIFEKISHQAIASFSFAAIPGVHPCQMKFMLKSVTRGLSKIWKASENLQKAIISCKYLEGARDVAVIRNLSRNIWVSFGVLMTIVGSPNADALKTFMEEPSLTYKILKKYCLHVLCAIMYVRKHDLTSRLSVDDYVQLLRDFFSSERVSEISGFSEEEKELTSQVTEFFHRLAGSSQ